MGHTHNTRKENLAIAVKNIIAKNVVDSAKNLGSELMSSLNRYLNRTHMFTWFSLSKD